MRVKLTVKEVKTLEKTKDGWQYRLNGDMLRGFFKTEQEAVEDCEKQLLVYLRQKLK